MTGFVIMLDLDGPVCTKRATVATGCDYDPVACGLIAKICKDTDAKIVLTSNRRFSDHVIHDLHAAGLGIYLYQHKDHWRIGGTSASNRGDDIDAWHDANPGYDYVIVDDDLTSYKYTHLSRLVHVDSDAGLSLHDADKIRSMIKNSSLNIDGPKADTHNLSSQIRAAIKAVKQGDLDDALHILDIAADSPLAR